MPHASEKNKHSWSDDVDRFGNHWQISTVVEKAFHIFKWLLSSLLHKQRERLSVTNLSSENNLSNVLTECSRRNIGKFFSELKLVTDNISLYLKPFMQGQRLTGAREPANVTMQTSRDLTFMQKVVSCMITLWP